MVSYIFPLYPYESMELDLNGDGDASYINRIISQLNNRQNILSMKYVTQVKSINRYHLVWQMNLLIHWITLQKKSAGLLRLIKGKEQSAITVEKTPKRYNDGH